MCVHFTFLHNQNIEKYLKQGSITYNVINSCPDNVNSIRVGLHRLYITAKCARYNIGRSEIETF